MRLLPAFLRWMHAATAARCHEPWRRSRLRLPPADGALRQIDSQGLPLYARHASTGIVGTRESQFPCGSQALLNENPMNTYAAMQRRETPRLLSIPFAQGPWG